VELCLQCSRSDQTLAERADVYAIQYVTALAQTNDWHYLTFLSLPHSPYLWVDTTCFATGRRFYRAVQQEVRTNMVCIQPGTFILGSPTNEVDRWSREGPQVTVTISGGFLIGRYEVTQMEYLSLMNSNPSYFTGDLSRPVERVSWDDATNYCALLTEQERLSGRLPEGCQYRLPTEAEWEYACRAGTTTRFSYGDDPGYTNLANYAWYSANSGNQTHPVGQKAANPWGLYDMHGNVLEWCLDWFQTYPGGSATNPPGPPVGMTRVDRGGSWDYGGDICRSAMRGDGYPWNRFYDIGIRVVLAPLNP
jgi:formylglycine-generating enzyme required for sulfatase activity